MLRGDSSCSSFHSGPDAFDWRTPVAAEFMTKTGLANTMPSKKMSPRLQEEAIRRPLVNNTIPEPHQTTHLLADAWLKNALYTFKGARGDSATGATWLGGNALQSSHRHFKHPEHKFVITVPGQDGKELAPGTLNAILKLAGLK
jgi:hypothetical protein